MMACVMCVWYACHRAVMHTSRHFTYASGAALSETKVFIDFASDNDKLTTVVYQVDMSACLLHVRLLN